MTCNRSTALLHAVLQYSGAAAADELMSDSEYGLQLQPSVLSIQVGGCFDGSSLEQLEQQVTCI
jgi:hypothetical protein